jgi:HNH endonuclease
MRCIFCKCDASSSTSQEHIIPESLWNISHVLPPGIVCDKCNNYFSREVEKPFLQSPGISALRFHQALPSKRGIIPAMAGVIWPNIPAFFHRQMDGEFAGSLTIPQEFIGVLMQRDKGELILPAGGPLPEGRVVSRFLAKVAVEAMAQRLLKNAAMLENWITDSQVDQIRNHARRGELSEWPVHVRRIYDADARFIYGRPQLEQTVHEFDFVQTTQMELYFVLALFGIEMTMNVGGPVIDGYLKWLDEHDGISPLYSGKNDPNFTNR